MMTAGKSRQEPLSVTIVPKSETAVDIPSPARCASATVRRAALRRLKRAAANAARPSPPDAINGNDREVGKFAYDRRATIYWRCIPEPVHASGCVRYFDANYTPVGVWILTYAFPDVISRSSSSLGRTGFGSLTSSKPNPIKTWK
jgi:hypothetical protein